MPQRNPGQRALGAVFLVLGWGSLGAAAFAPKLIGDRLPGVGTWAALLVAGCVLTLMGVLMLFIRGRVDREPEPAVPAHVAFASKMDLPSVPTPERATRPMRATPPPATGPAAAIDAEIRELTKRINKAGVQLATGQLSQQGYALYVDDLKKQRADLETKRARSELSNR